MGSSPTPITHSEIPAAPALQNGWVTVITSRDFDHGGRTEGKIDRPHRMVYTQQFCDEHGMFLAAQDLLGRTRSCSRSPSALKRMVNRRAMRSHRVSLVPSGCWPALVFAACAFGVAGPVGSLQAQQSVPRANVIATVKDEAGRSVPAAQLRVDSAAWLPVESTGTLAIQTAPGRHVIHARAVGLGLDSLRINVSDGESLAAILTLHQAHVLTGVTVTGKADTVRVAPSATIDWNEGFDSRRAHATGGSFLDRAAIDKRGAVRMSELLRSLPGVALLPIGGPLGGNDYMVVMRGIATVKGEVCPVQYYLDGHPYQADDNVDRLITPKEVVAMEVYPGASQVPPQFKGPTSRCGVIVIWTRSAR